MTETLQQEAWRGEAPTGKEQQEAWSAAGTTGNARNALTVAPAPRASHAMSVFSNDQAFYICPAHVQGADNIKPCA